MGLENLTDIATIEYSLGVIIFSIMAFSPKLIYKNEDSVTRKPWFRIGSGIVALFFIIMLIIHLFF